jgi:hypothetical protein
LPWLEFAICRAMKGQFLRIGSTLIGILVSIILVLVLVMVLGSVYQQKILYKELNRKLIIKNDSLICATIELTNPLKNKMSGQDASFNYKLQKHK